VIVPLHILPTPTTDAVIHLRPGHPKPYSFACSLCRFYREYQTEAGATNGAAQHLLQLHGKKSSVAGLKGAAVKEG